MPAVARDRGVRARVRLPGGGASVVVAAVISLYVGLVGASTGVLLGGYPRPPSDARAAQVSTVAFGHQPHNVVGPVVYCDLICPPRDGQDEIVAYDAPPDRTDRVVVFYEPPPEQVPGLMVRAHDRLAAAGWHVDPLWIQDDAGQQFEASHDGLNILVLAVPAEGPGPPAAGSLMIVVSKDFTVVSVGALVVGTIGGLLAGWLLAVWVLGRYRRQARSRRAAVVAVAVPFLLVGPLSIALTALFAVVNTTTEATPKAMQTPLIMLLGLWPATAVTVASALLSLALAVLPGRGQVPPPTDPPTVAPAPAGATG